MLNNEMLEKDWVGEHDLEYFLDMSIAAQKIIQYNAKVCHHCDCE